MIYINRRCGIPLCIDMQRGCRTSYFLYRIYRKDGSFFFLWQYLAQLCFNFTSMKEKTSAGAVKIEQAECNQARLRLLRRSLFYLKILSQKLHPNDILRKFATGMAVASDCHRTLRIKMTSITLPFDSRKSRKFTENPADLGTSKTTFSLRSLAGFLKRINQWIASDAHAYRAWAAPAVLLIRVVREPTWAKYRRVCSRLFFLLFAIMPMMASAQTSSRTKNTTYQLKNLNKHHTMPQIIKSGGGLFSKGELLRINPSNNTLLANTTKELYYSTNGGRS